MENLKEGMEGLGRFLTPLRWSNVYETSPIGCPAGSGDYLDMVAVFDTKLSPEETLKALLSLEKELGRVRPIGVVNAPRTLDLDLLFYEGSTLETEFLTLPHPRMAQRLFVQLPLSEVACELCHCDLCELAKTQTCRLFAPWFAVHTKQPQL